MGSRIAFISDHASPLALLGGTDSGGQNVYVAELAVHLVDLGYQIDIYTRWENPKVAQVVGYRTGVRVIHVQAGPVEVIPKEEIFCYMDDFYQHMLSFITAEGITYQLIHANFWMSGMVAIRLKASLNIPFVITFHALGQVRKIHQKENDKFPPERIRIEEEIVEKADYVIAECPQDREDLLQHYHAVKERIIVIPCGFNPKEFFPMNKLLCRKILLLDPEEKIILQLGRMVPRKGVDNVIRAMALLKKSALKIRLVIVGGESDPFDQANNKELIRLKELAEELEVAERVIFAGRKDREELKSYYNAADIFVTTPWYEPFGITPLEAMACATPVIGADVGGIKYSLIDGKTGFLIAPDQPELLKERILELANNEVLLHKMGKNALRHVHQHFTWEKVALKISNLYTAVLSHSPVAAVKEEWKIVPFRKTVPTEVSYAPPRRKKSHQYGS